eukprot:c15039_g1_i1.p1 GENE.c15039_g1_i1~~c15039_g1_i1.p1  ORF type:complete len:372 (-),score=94.84 c15039_g1_i1:110-1225(-)
MSTKAKHVVAVIGASSGEKIDLGDDIQVENWNFTNKSQLGPSALKNVDVVVIPQGFEFGAEEFGANENLLGVFSLGESLKTVDVEAASKAKIRVSHVPEDKFGIDEAADHAMGLILCLYRKTHVSSQLVKEGRMFHGPEEIAAGAAQGARRIRGQVLGLVGFGRVAIALVRRAQAYGFKVTVFDPAAQPGLEDALGCQRVLSLAQLVSTSDCVVLVCRPDEKNAHMINEEMLATMKKDSFLVNIAQGELIDNQALANSLTSHHLAGAALDAFEQHPFDINSSVLKDCPNLLCTPHSAFTSREIQQQIKNIVFDEVVRLIEGKPLQHCVNDAACPPLQPKLKTILSASSSSSLTSSTPATKTRPSIWYSVLS